MMVKAVSCDCDSVMCYTSDTCGTN